MKTYLEAAGRTFVQVFVGALIVYGAGILKAPDLTHSYLIAVSAIIASFAFGLAAFVNALNRSDPTKFSFVRWFGHPVGDWLDAFALAFFSTLIVTLPGVLGAPDFATLKAVIVGAITGAVAAGVRAFVGALTPGEKPFPDEPRAASTRASVG